MLTRSLKIKCLILKVEHERKKKQILLGNKILIPKPLLLDAGICYINAVCEPLNTWVDSEGNPVKPKKLGG